MDIDIVNTILRLCHERQTCLFEVPMLSEVCLEQRLCTNPKHVLASIKNYMEIFKISRDRNRIELFMPVGIREIFFSAHLLVFFSSLKSAGIILCLAHVTRTGHRVRIFMSATTISARIPAVVRSIARICINSMQHIMAKSLEH